MPLNWLMLFFLFSSTLVLFSIMNYYIFNYNTPLSINLSSPSSKPLNWKW